MPEPQTQQGPQTETSMIPGAEAFIVVSAESAPINENPESQQQAAEVQPDDEQGTQQTQQANDDAHPSEEVKQKSRWQRKQEQLSRERERADNLEKELAALKGSGQESGAKEPDIVDFEDYEAYEVAKTEWNKKKNSPTPTESSSPQMSPALRYAVDDMQESWDDARKKYLDFDKVIRSSDVPLTEPVLLAVAETDNPGEVTYYLATHKDEAAQIAAMSPVKQAKAMAEVEKKAARQEPPKKRSSAPPPIEPIEGAGGGGEKGLSEMSFSEKEAFYKSRKKSGMWS